MRILLCTYLLLLPLFSWAMPSALTYQGKITKPDGTALEYSAVSFRFSITDQSKSCVLYQELVSNVDLTGSNGIFSIAIGQTGSPIFPVSGKVSDAFKDDGTLSCKSGSTIAATSITERYLIVEFYDGTQWNQVTPDSSIRAMPYSIYANSATKLEGHTSSEFILKSGVTTCTTGQYLTFDGTSFSCQTDTGGTGTLTSISVSSPLVKSGTAAAPALSITVGTSSGSVAAGDDSRFGNALKIQGVSVDSTAPTSNQYLKYNGSSWAPATLSLAVSDISGLSTQLGNKVDTTMFPTSCTAGQSLVFVTPANKFDCYDISITASQISGTIPFSKLASTPTTLSGYGITDAVQNQGGTPGIKSGLNASRGTASTAGNLYVSTDSKEIYRDNGSTWDLISSAGGSALSAITQVGSYIGIGQSSPAATLDINGFAKMKLNTSAPVACSSTTYGSIALTQAGGMCVCTISGNWYVANTSTACTWELPAGCTGLGELCSDGTYYVGKNAAGKFVFTTATDSSSQTWADSAGTFQSVTGADNGQANTTALVGYGAHAAATYCDNLVLNGYSDWYLPATNELKLVYNVRSTIGVDMTGGWPNGYYWASTEKDNNNAISIRMQDGFVNETDYKTNGHGLRCVRQQ